MHTYPRDSKSQAADCSTSLQTVTSLHLSPRPPHSCQLTGVPARWPRRLPGPAWRGGPGGGSWAQPWRQRLLGGHQCPGRACPGGDPGVCPMTSPAPRQDWPPRGPWARPPRCWQEHGAWPASGRRHGGGHRGRRGQRTHLVKAVGPLASATLVLWETGRRVRQASGSCPLRPGPRADLAPAGEARPARGRVLWPRSHSQGRACGRRRGPGALAPPAAGSAGRAAPAPFSVSVTGPAVPARTRVALSLTVTGWHALAERWLP